MVDCTVWEGIKNRQKGRKDYTGLLNNMGLNCAGPLIHGFFSIVNTTVLHELNPQMQNLGYGHWTVNLYSDFPLLGVGTPNPCVVQGSTVHLYGGGEKEEEQRNAQRALIGKRECRELCKGSRSMGLRDQDPGKGPSDLSRGRIKACSKELLLG